MSTVIQVVDIMVVSPGSTNAAIIHSQDYLAIAFIIYNSLFGFFFFFFERIVICLQSMHNTMDRYSALCFIVLTVFMIGKNHNYIKETCQSDQLAKS